MNERPAGNQAYSPTMKEHLANIATHGVSDLLVLNSMCGWAGLLLAGAAPDLAPPLDNLTIPNWSTTEFESTVFIEAKYFLHVLLVQNC